MRSFFIFLLFLVGCTYEPEYDVLIINGKVVDGSGRNPIFASVGVKNDKIINVGDLKGSALKIINAKGLIVSPGFIDMHTHAVRGIFDVPTAEAFLFQGVTTLTDGNDGSSPLPIGEHYEKISSTKISPNWAVFVGQGTVRREVMGLENRAPTTQELEQMISIVDQAMKDGALGLSSGLFYVPGSFSTKNEVVELAKVASKYGGIYISHMRDEAALIIESVNETIDIGKLAELPAVITHHKVIGKSNWGLSKETLKLVDAAVNEGFDVYLDQYPYTASQTSLRALIPQWAQAGGREMLLQRIEDSEIRAQIKEEIIERILFDRGGGDPKNVVISEAKWDTSLEGKNLAEITISYGLEPSAENAAETVFKIYKQGNARAVFHAISDEDVKNIMRHPRASIASDGPMMIFGEGKPHPRSYGTYPRVLAKYVREQNIISLPEAIRKMTSLPAKVLSIKERGLIKEGYYADIVIFNEKTISDNATFQNPHQYSNGVEFVLVNGIVVVEGGNHTGAKPGKVLHGPGYK
tara:strand:+ start:1852 stop:3420 length:1569 start_codon:yes stop_codon:yes gene_type:complete